MACLCVVTIVLRVHDAEPACVVRHCKAQRCRRWSRLAQKNMGVFNVDSTVSILGVLVLLCSAAMNVPGLLSTASDSTPCTELLQLASETADACQAALTTATAAAEPQGLIQAYTRLQQQLGKSIAVPAGAPASMAMTSKVLAIVEGLMAGPPRPPASAASVTLATGETSQAPGQKPASASSGRAAADKAAAVPAATKAEQVNAVCRPVIPREGSMQDMLWVFPGLATATMGKHVMFGTSKP